MANIVAKTAYKFWPEWGEDLMAQFRRQDPRGSGVLLRHVFFSCLTTCGLHLSTVIVDRLIDKYTIEGQISYKTFMEDLTKEVQQLKCLESQGSQSNKKYESVVYKIIDGTAEPEDTRPQTSAAPSIYGDESEENDAEALEDIDEETAENEFRVKFRRWVDGVIEKYESEKVSKKAEDMTPDELDRYASLLFLLISEEGHNRDSTIGSGKGVKDLMMCIPEWPQCTVSFYNFRKVCKRELNEVTHLGQVFRNNAVPAQSIHTTMTFQQFSVLACGISNVSISRMIISLKNAPNSSAVSSVNVNAGNGLYSRFNTWKDYIMGFVSGKSLFDGIKSSLPTEPYASIKRFVKECVRKEADPNMLDSEPVMFSVFSKLMRDEAINKEEMGEENASNNGDHKMNDGESNDNKYISREEKEEKEKNKTPTDDESLIRGIKALLLEASNNNSDKIYDMLVYAAINNPPYKSDVVVIDAILRSITAGLNVRLSPQQQALIARRLREASGTGTDIIPIRLFMEVFGMNRRGALSSIPLAITSPERHGRFVPNAQRESRTRSPTIARHINPAFAAKQNNSENVIFVLEHQNDLPIMSPPRQIEQTGVKESFTVEPIQALELPKREQGLVEKNIIEDEHVFAEKRKEALDHATAAEGRRRQLGYSNDLYRSENIPPSRRGTRWVSSDGVRSALCWDD